MELSEDATTLRNLHFSWLGGKRIRLDEMEEEEKGEKLQADDEDGVVQVNPIPIVIGPVRSGPPGLVFICSGFRICGHDLGV